MSQDSAPRRDDADFVSRLHRVADEAKAADVKPVSALEEEALAAIAGAPAPISCLGWEGDRWVLWTTAKDRPRRLIKLLPNQFTWSYLLTLASEEELARWLTPCVKKLFPDRNPARPPDRRELVDAAEKILTAQGRTRGDVTPETRRNVGIWTAVDFPEAIAAETKGWIYNSGAGCYSITPDGIISESENYSEGYIYFPSTGAKPAPAPADAPLSDEEAGEVRKIITARTWAAPCEGVLVSGWILSALLSGANPIRPHLSITAPAGSGKTALKTALEAVLPFCHRAEGGGTTEAAVRQMTAGSSAPLLFDEAEPSDDEKGLKNVKEVIRLSRLSFSGADVPKGGSDNVHRRFLVYSSFAFFAIRDAITDDADKSRTLSCALRPANADTLRRLEADRERGIDIVRRPDYKERMLRRVLEALPAYSRNRRKLAIELRGRLEGVYRADLLARRVDVYATLIAAEWIWKSTGDITPEAMQQGIEAAEAMCRADMSRDDGSDAEACLAFLLRRTVRSSYGERTVATLAQAVARGTEEKDSAAAALDALGMDVSTEGACLRIDARRGNLRKVFRDSPWRDGNVMSLLADNEGVKACKMRFHGSNPVPALKIALSLIEAPTEEAEA